jgi:hypothetical protein
MPTTVHLTDRLDDIIESTWDEVKELLKDYFIEHGGDLPCLHNDLNYSGDISELIDSAVPIWTSELNELAYFHHDAAISALVDTFGSADGGWPSGAFAAGLYTLIEQGLNEKWLEEAEDLWQEYLDELDTATIRKAALAQWTAAQPSTDTEPATTPEA